jgi:hypothetical protein
VRYIMLLTMFGSFEVKHDHGARKSLSSKVKHDHGAGKVIFVLGLL